MPRDLIEPEGVNAEPDAPGRTGDPVPGGDAAAHPPEETPADDALGAPPDPSEQTYGSEPPA